METILRPPDDKEKLEILFQRIDRLMGMLQSFRIEMESKIRILVDITCNQEQKVRYDKGVFERALVQLLETQRLCLDSGNLQGYQNMQGLLEGMQKKAKELGFLSLYHKTLRRFEAKNRGDRAVVVEEEKAEEDNGSC